MFAHLRVHTEYSITDGTVRVEPPKRKGGGQGATLTSKAAELGIPALAVTDLSNVFATAKVFKAAEGAGIKPIAGVDVLLAAASGLADDPPERLTLLVANEAGYANLCTLLSRAYAQGQNRHGAVLARAWLASGLSEGLIALTGKDGALARALIGEQLEAADALRAELAALFPARLYLEVCRCERPGDEAWVQLAAAYGRYAQLPLVATNDVRFLTRNDFDAHEARVCIASGRVLADEKRPHDFTEEQYLKSPEEMAALFHDLPEALENTLHIARRCTFALKMGVYHLPNFPVPTGHTPDSWLQAEAERGLEERLAVITPFGTVDDYRERLAFEIGVIKKMGFAGYFLTVADFIRWAKENGCPVGPGRGSGAGSLVAFSLKITDLDPLPYKLLFERFLNPERVSMPDFDIDFCMDNRDKVIRYVAEKYGREYVGQIVTYNTMAAKGVVRDVTRILGLGYGFGDRIAKLIPATPGATLAEAVETIPELKKAYAEEDDVKAVLELALELEGITRGVGVHAGGVVIAPLPLSSYAPTYCEDDGSGMRTQFDMKDIEAIGLVKFDFLGLKTLTVIEEAVRNIALKTGEKIDVLKIPLTDAATYRLFASGKTGAVFQMESPGMQRAATDLKPDCFEDIIALVSLYRPGPMEKIPEFCARKRGDIKVEYLHPEMEPVLKPTYGIFVYQEQVMEMSQRLAGYTLGGADLLRRAMGKKIKAEMEKQRSIFTEGAIARGVGSEAATKVFDLMAKFADYGFNKSHAAAYALVSYHTAWLKTHHPAEFMAAVLSCEMGNPDAIVAMREEALRMGLKVLTPCINQSFYRFTVPGPRAVRYGLGAVKGVGEAALEGIIAERTAHGPFADLFDFCRRIDLKKANKKVMEALIFSGSLDALGANRASLLKTLPKALGHAERATASASSGQNDLFGAGAATATKAEQKMEPEKATEWPLAERLQHELETLGFYLSGHPIETYRPLIEGACSARLPAILAQLPPVPKPLANGKTPWVPRAKHLFAAWVGDIRYFKPREGATGLAARASYKLNLTDGEATITTFVDAEKWEPLKSIVKIDEIVFVQADLAMSQREGREPEARLYNPEFFSPTSIAADYALRLMLKWERGAGEVAMFRNLIAPFKSPDGVPVQIEVLNAMAGALLDFPAEWRLKLSENALTALKSFLSDDCVKVQYRRYTPPPSERKSARGFGNAAAGFGSGSGDDE